MYGKNFVYNKTYFVGLFVLLFYANVCYSAENENPEVEISLGKIKGSLMKTRLGKTIYSFRGIKYAKPPTGERRFKPAEPVDPWTDVYDATQDGPACPYPGGKNISEDCLILNIYTTMLPSEMNSAVHRPVIVYFHTARLYLASSQSFMLGPQYLMDKDIVLVTSNYRVGPLGLTATGNQYAPGNLDLKDQVMVLRFIRDHIAAFGGDPNSVTISGLCAGSRSVFLHMLSPMSKGLFHRAIGLSGAPLTAEPTPHHDTPLAIRLAEYLNCPTENMEVMFKCLKEKPAEDFVDAPLRIKEWRKEPRVLYRSVVEPDIPGIERFLPAQPVDLIRSGQVYEVPIFAGVTQDELAHFNMRAIEDAQDGDNTFFNELNDRWEELAPITFMYERETERSKIISRELFNYYFHNQSISLSNSNGVGLLFADSIIIFPVHRMTSLLTQVIKMPLYFYEFKYQSGHSTAYWSNGRPFGVSHDDDLIYLFHKNDSFPLFGEDDPESIMVEKLTSMWAHFAKTGQPIPLNNELFEGVVWEPMTAQNRVYLEIGENFTMKSNLHADRMQLWERLFPLQNYNYTTN